MFNLKSFHLRLILLILLLNNYIPVKSQDQDIADTLNLDEIFVSANKLETQFAETPLSSLIISRNEMKRNISLKLSDILSEQNGLYLVPDYTVGGLEGVQIQGIAADYIQILINGVPSIGRFSGNINLDRFNLENVRQVEIVKGPSSSLYGSAALGGVINIITNKNLKNSSIILNQSFGSNSMFDTNLTLSQKLKKIDLILTMNKYSNDGYDFDKSDEFNTVDPNSSYTLDISISSKPNSKFDFFQNLKYFNNYIKSRLINSSTIESTSHSKISQDLSKKIEINYELYFSNFENNDRLKLNSSLSSFYYHNLIKPEIRLYHKGKQSSVLGFSLEKERLNRSLFEKKIKSNLYSIFLKYDFNLFENLNFTVGSRYDNHSNYKSKISSKISFKYYINDKISTYFSFGQGYKTPDFRQLYLNFTNTSVGYSVFGKFEEKNGINNLSQLGEILNIIIPEDELGGVLSPELSNGLNFGFNFKLNKIKSQINFFRNDITNLIDTRVIARKKNGQNIFGYENVGNVFTTGLEFSNKYQISDRITLRFDYQFLKAFDKEIFKKIKENKLYARDPYTLRSISLKQSDVYGLANRSKNNFKISLNYHEKYFLSLKYRDKFGLYDTNGNDIIDQFDDALIKDLLLINFTYIQKIKDKLNMTLGIKNIGDYKNHKLLTNIFGREYLLKLDYKF